MKLLTPLLYANRKEKQLAFLFAFLLGLTLAIGFLPSVHSLYTWISASRLNISLMNSKLLEMFLFPLTALCFHLSIPKKARFKSTPDTPLANLLLTLPIPILIAFLYGFIRMRYFGISSLNQFEDFVWVVLCIPIGEELLFRGWVHTLAYRMFGRKFMSLSSPIPVISWVSSLSFALWHLQNYQNSTVSFTGFQLLYTFFTGLWLCHLRWNAGQISICIFAHLSLNLAAILPLILCYN